MVGKTVKASFPSNLERTVASALLLLSSSAASKSEDCCSAESRESSGCSASKSEGGSWSVEASAGGEPSHEQPLRVDAFVPAYQELKFKIVQKKRSKSVWISDSKKLKTTNPEPISAPTSSDSVSEITTTQASSSFSSSSSAQSASSKTISDKKFNKSAIPGHMGRKAAAILRILSNGSASEVRIRQLLGDSPSTSKALRMLLKLQEVKRSGSGGRIDPYTYMIA
ncbi:uncharacterized protein LOC127263610 [Andrographis paniculata]|uniref:uncharacterized protein LOC127263610 n=1 Tax=Andrographis paniculata TaxID=175694 RepID=UPI0021E706B2|nr:uncharacterized protein LOC127263610 [Andrographis paniculata]